MTDEAQDVSPLIVFTVLQDTGASQQNGGNLVFSTTGTSAGATVTDRLTIDSSGLATFGSSLTLASSSSTLTSSGNTVLGSGSTNTLTVNGPAQFNAAATFNAVVTYGGAVTVAGLLTANGSTVLGTGSSNTLTVNAAAQFNAAVTAGNNLNVAGTFTASGSSTLGTSNSNMLTVNAVANFASAAAFAAAVTANNAVSIAGLLTASGSSVLGTSSSNTLTVNAVATFNAVVQLLGTSNSAATAPTMIYMRQYPSAAAAATNAMVGSAVYSRWDGSAYNPTAQIRSVYTVRPFLAADNIALQELAQMTSVIMAKHLVVVCWVDLRSRKQQVRYVFKEGFRAVPKTFLINLSSAVSYACVQSWASKILQCKCLLWAEQACFKVLRAMLHSLVQV